MRHAKGVNYTLRTLHEGTETLIRPGTEVNIMTGSGLIELKLVASDGSREGARGPPYFG